MKKVKKSSYFSPVFVRQGGGSNGKIHFFPIEGVKFCLREGDCVLGGQPMGIPPYPSPCPCVTIPHSASPNNPIYTFFCSGGDRFPS